MFLTLDIHVAEGLADLPPTEGWQAAADAALAVAVGDGSAVEWQRVADVSVVPAEDSEALNADWRDKQRPTNVLAFPVPDGATVMLPGSPARAGDLVLCADVIAAEARAQGKSLEHHYMHMIVHGCLHLIGYDHIDPDEARHMEALERQALSAIGVPDPY